MQGEIASAMSPARELDEERAGDPCLQLDGPRGASSSELVQDVRERLQRRLARDATLDQIANDLRLSGRTLQRKLGEAGASFQGILTDVRMARAHSYLTETDDPVGAIATRLGYGDAANFRRAFRRWTGMPPGDFRARHRAHGSS